MFTPLSKITLHDLWNQSILFDANIFMMGINERSSDANYSFDSMKRLYIIPLFESFTDIYIHNEVYKELDDEARAIVDTYRGKIYMARIPGTQRFLIILRVMSWCSIKDQIQRIEERFSALPMPRIIT